MSNDVLNKQKSSVNPIVILLGILFAAMLLTFILDSGAYQREGGLVIPGSYSKIEKDRSITGLFSMPALSQEGVARPVGIAGTLLAIPKGLKKGAGLIFMVLIIGGMFGLLKKTGVIDEALDALLAMVKGNVYLLVPALMLMFSAGSTFLGLASEYLLLIPVMVSMVLHLGLPRIIGLAIVTIGVKIGYIASVTSPISLSIAQPLVGLQIFSGAGMRFAFYLVFLVVGVAFVLWTIKKYEVNREVTTSFEATSLSARHKLLLAALVFGVGFLVYASNKWHWSHDMLTAYYIGLSILFTVLSGLGTSEAAHAFVDGMKKVLMASFLIGVAMAVSIVLAEGKVLDTVVFGLTNMINNNGPIVAAQGMFFSQLLMDVMIPSTSGQAAVSMPILGPVGQLAGVSQQTIVLAFLFGNGLTNMITPTSGTLLAFLATAEIGWGEWAKFIFPLWVIFALIAMAMLAFATVVGF